jgi:hypothetical protein
MGISRFPIRPGVDLRNINSASPRGPFFFNRQRGRCHICHDAKQRHLQYGRIVNWKADSPGRILGGMSESSGYRSCKCGAVYDRSEHIVEAREISSFECAVCGKTIENWNSAWVPRYRFIACPATDAE